MIYFSTKDGKHVVVLDPANVAQLKSGDSLMTPDGVVILSFTPDTLWLSGELEKVFSGEEKVLTPVKLKELLREGLARVQKEEAHVPDSPIGPEDAPPGSPS